MKKSRLPYLLIGLLVIWCLILSLVIYHNYENNKEKEIVNEYNVTGFSTDFTKVVDDNKTSIVTISSGGNVSSGFVYKQVDNKVYILTSYHGISNGYATVIFNNSYSTHGSLVGKDIYADLAVIVIDSEYSIKPLIMGDSTGLNDGEFVISIGTPKSVDYSSSVELGLISNDTRVVKNSISVENITSEYYLDVIQLSGNLAPGYSGSPILNMNGEVVGMTIMSLDDDINFALTANEIKIVADKIINGEECIKHHTGLKGTFISQMPTYIKSNLNLPLSLLNGLYIDEVMANSLASLGEIKKGDVVISINGVDINNLNDYLNVLYSDTDVLEFKVLRDDNTLTLTVHINA